jgi:heavy metal sensor kinase
MPKTFRGRLTMTLSALSIGVLGLASVLIYSAIRWGLLRNLDQSLLTLARTEIASAFDEPGGFAHVHDQAPVTIELRALAYDKVTEIFNANGEVVDRTENLDNGPALELERSLVARAIAGEAVFADTQRGSLRYRALYHPLDDLRGAKYAIVLAVPRRPVELTLEIVFAVLLVALVAGAGLAAIAASRVSRRLTRPLDRIAEAARGVGEANLAARIPEVSRDSELRELVGLLNDMLERLDAAFASQRRFVADASHELRSPLSNLRGTIEVALRHPRSIADYQETLAVSLQEIERLARLVQNLLTLSRAEARRLPLDSRPLDLGELASRAIDVHAARAAGRDVRLELESDAPMTVNGDADRLREVVDNLLDNALRVAPKGTRIRIGVKREDGRAVLEVEDGGPGLSDEEQAHVFEPFARGMAAGGDGAGLGLAIARAIAEAHGGRLRVRSTLGQGATFRLELPSHTPTSRPLS